MNALREEVLELRHALDEFETRRNENAVPTDALEDFKVTVDSIRTSVLAMLTAENPEEYRSFIHKYRLRRAAVICQSVFSGLIDGTIDRNTPGLEQLQGTVDETLARLEEIERE